MFFSVKKPIKILGKSYIPCVCYPMPKTLEKTILDLETRGLVKLFDKEVYFLNGKIFDKKEKTEKKKRFAKAVKKEDIVEQANLEISDDTF